MSFEDEYESLVEEARKRTKTASKDYIPKCCEILRKNGLPQGKITSRIRSDFGDIWSPKTIYEAIPDEYKKETKPKKIHPRESILLEQSSSGTIETPEPTHRPEPEIEVPNPPMAKSDDLIGPDGVMYVGTDHDFMEKTGSIRIVMSAAKFSGLGKAMVEMVKKGSGGKGNYVIEYDPAERELYIDEAEKDEKVMVND